LKADFDQQKSNFNEEKSALVEAVKVVNAGNEVNCQLLEKANTRLTELKANFDQQKSILDKDKSPLVDAVKVAKSETEEKCILLDEAQT
jgi:predicted S18 family serine protease